MDSGDTAWMLMSTALVMIMLPGLALFYGGLVRRKNVLSTIMQSFFGLALVSVVWVIVGFTLAFGPDVERRSGLIGGLDFVGSSTASVSSRSTVYAVTIPFVLFAAFQLMFAAITPALITGAFAERKRFGAFVLFTILWSILVYSPIAHWVWSTDGWLFKLGALDFAGGTVVHISSGVSALVVALLDRPARRQRRPDGAARRPDDRPRRRPPLVRLVRLQRRIRAGRRRPGRQRVHRHQHRGGRRDHHLGPRELPAHAQGQRRRCRLRRGRRPRRHHAGLGLRDVGGALVIGLVAGGLCYSATLLASGSRSTTRSTSSPSTASAARSAPSRPASSPRPRSRRRYTGLLEGNPSSSSSSSSPSARRSPTPSSRRSSSSRSSTSILGIRVKARGRGDAASTSPVHGEVAYQA